ncbi:MAG: hypothetical protein SO441_07590 [Candidatus Limivicinus sp.]|nr:hypothetical protein [Candidatus Limivicinus sp.]
MKNKSFSHFTFVNLLFGLAMGCLWGVIMADYCLKLAAQISWPLVLLVALAALLCLALAFVLQIILHELGHLLFGLLSGYRFVSFRFGFRLLAQRGQLCRCVMCPPEPDQDGYFPLALYSLGGIFLNLLSGLLFLLLYFISGGMLLLTLFSLSAGILGLGFGLMFALPVKYSDGYNALWLNDDDAALHGHWLRLREEAAGESEE